jgi:GNAT superfamily N-acetyltransferase
MGNSREEGLRFTDRRVDSTLWSARLAVSNGPSKSKHWRCPLGFACVPDLDAADLLARYDAQLRSHVPDPLPAGVHVARDGPLLRFVGFGHGGFVGYRDLGGLEGPELDELIARQVRVFADRGEQFEWKLHRHDRPADLAERLTAMGFVPEDVETVVIAPVSVVAGEALLPDGVMLREVRGREDLDRIGAMEEAIWHDDRAGWLADALEVELAVDPDAMTIVVAEAAGETVCAGWMRFMPGTDFATLWGGGTLSEWRGRGIYRALVAYRANLAAQRGVRYLQVDASADSRPILQRLGFVAVTTTTPFIWTPPASVP